MNFLLIHGSWHNGNCWQRVADTLTAHGHQCYTPTLLAHGSANTVDSLCFQDYIDDLVNYIEATDLRDLVLVGHSMGGTVICKLAEAIPDRVVRLVFIAALIARDGHALVDEVPPDYAAMFADIAAQSADNSVRVPWPVWRESFIGDADCAVARHCYDGLCAEPFAPMQEKLSMDGFHRLDVPRSYINCLDDVVFPPGQWAWFPRMYHRIAPARLVQMPGSHEVMYTRPEELAGNIIIAGRD